MSDKIRNYKNKKAQGLSIGGIVTIMLIIVAMGLVWLVCIKLIFSSEPQFTIYKEVCENESYNKWVETNISTCNKYLFNGESMQCYNESEGDFKCDEEECLFVLIKKTEQGLKYYGDIKIIDVGNKNIRWNKLIRVYEQICEQVEVDEMVIPKDLFLEFCFRENFDKETCQGLWIKAIEEHNYKMPSITKEEITIGLLEETCECVEINFRRLRFYEKSFDEWMIKLVEKDGCRTYKCRNYTIEVLK